ncbi:MAG: hypothetical protein IKM09_00270 [Clostridia bacterium]|nr:hypothetical protein [Clostridia bacterium]
MRNIKLLFSSFTVAFAILGLTKALSYDITMPITFLFLAITMFINAAENKQNGQKKSALCFLLLGIFLLAVTVYNTVSRFI